MMKTLHVLGALFALFLLVSVYGEENEPDVQISTLKASESCERRTQFNDIIKVHFEGFLEHGKQIDSSYDKGKPMILQLGHGQVIRGWERGLLAMCEGEKRKLIVPPNLAYGDKEHDEIPAGSTLEFHIELLEIQDRKGLQDSFDSLDLDKNGYLDMKEVSENLDRAANLENLPVKLDHSMKYRLIQTLFMQLDKDRDGTLNKVEFDALINLAKGREGSKDLFKDMKLEL